MHFNSPPIDPLENACASGEPTIREREPDARKTSLEASARDQAGFAKPPVHGPIVRRTAVSMTSLRSVSDVERWRSPPRKRP